MSEEHPANLEILVHEAADRTLEIPVNEIGTFIDPETMITVLENAVRKKKVVEPYRCTIRNCKRWTDNPPYNGVCRTCQEMGNFSNVPFEIISQVMDWNGAPVDLLDVLQSTGKTVEELVEIAHSPGGQEVLAGIWDEATRFPINTVRTGFDRVEDNRNLNRRTEYRNFVATEESEWVYKSRPRPKTPKERAEEAEKSQRLEQRYEDRAEKFRQEAARSAFLAALEKAKDAGIDITSLVAGEDDEP